MYSSVKCVTSPSSVCVSLREELKLASQKSQHHDEVLTFSTPFIIQMISFLLFPITVLETED